MRGNDQIETVDSPPILSPWWKNKMVAVITLRDSGHFSSRISFSISTPLLHFRLFHQSRLWPIFKSEYFTKSPSKYFDNIDYITPQFMGQVTFFPVFLQNKMDFGSIQPIHSCTYTKQNSGRPVCDVWKYTSI